MSFLEPPKHGHGGEPDKKKLHRAFLYLKFTRWVMAIIAGYAFIDTVTSTIILMTTDIEIELMMWGSIPVNNDSIIYGNVIVVIIMAFVFLYVGLLFARVYKRVKYAHLAYCRCDRKRWYNRE